MLNYRWLVVMGVVVLGLVASGVSVRAQEDPAQKYAGQTPDATVDLDEVQIAYLVMGDARRRDAPLPRPGLPVQSRWAGSWGSRCG